jgi:hypothetical protein
MKKTFAQIFGLRMAHTVGTPRFEGVKVLEFIPDILQQITGHKSV